MPSARVGLGLELSLPSNMMPLRRSELRGGVVWRGVGHGASGLRTQFCVQVLAGALRPVEDGSDDEEDRHLLLGLRRERRGGMQQQGSLSSDAALVEAFKKDWQ